MLRENVIDELANVIRRNGLMYYHFAHVHLCMLTCSQNTNNTSQILNMLDSVGSHRCLRGVRVAQGQGGQGDLHGDQYERRRQISCRIGPHLQRRRRSRHRALLLGTIGMFK